MSNMFIYILKASGPSRLAPSHTVFQVCRTAFQSREAAKEYEEDFRRQCTMSAGITGIDVMESVTRLDISPIYMRPDLGEKPIRDQRMNTVAELAFKVSQAFKKMDGLDKKNPGAPGAVYEKNQMFHISALIYAISRRDWRSAKDWLDRIAKNSDLDRPAETSTPKRDRFEIARKPHGC